MKCCQKSSSTFAVCFGPAPGGCQHHQQLRMGTDVLVPVVLDSLVVAASEREDVC